MDENTQLILAIKHLVAPSEIGKDFCTIDKSKINGSILIIINNLSNIAVELSRSGKKRKYSDIVSPKTVMILDFTVDKRGIDDLYIRRAVNGEPSIENRLNGYIDFTVYHRQVS